MSIISKRTIVALCIFILTLLPYATSAAFNPPGGTPPSGNVDPPLYSIGTETLTGNLIINSSSGTSLQGSGGTIGLQGSGSTYGVQGLLSSDGAAGGAGLYINSRNADNNGVAVPPIIDYAAYIYSNTGTFGIGLQSTAAIYGSGPGLDIFFMQRDSGLVWPRLSDGAMLYGVSVTSGGKLRVLGHGDGISFLDQEVKALVNIDETPGDPKLDLVNGTDLCFAGDCKVSWSDVVTDSGWTQNDSDLYPNSTGWHVGIGTTDPDELLEVKDGHIAQYHASSADTAGYRIKGFSDGGGTKTQLGIFGLRQNDASAAGGEFLIGLHDGSSVVDRFVIDKDGNVGIGTTSPLAKFHAVRTAGSPGNLAEFDTLSIAQFQADGSDTNSLYIAEKHDDGMYLQATDGTTDSSTAHSISLNPFGGNVGIGTTSPTGLLEVTAGTDTTGTLFVADNNVTIGGRNAVGGNVALNVEDRLGNPYFTVNTNTNIISMATVAGKVGIGTSSPAYKFHVSGTGATYAIIEDVSGNQGLQFKKGGSQTWFIVSEPGSSDRLVIQDADSSAGVILAQDGTSWGAYSDIRMKKNIEKIDNTLEKVNSIRGIKYQKKNQTSNKTYLGVIAQEVELHFPEIIDTDGQGYKSVQYSLITPILIEAIKELNTKTETQNSAIQEQQVQIESLKLLICPDNPNAEICNQ